MTESIDLKQYSDEDLGRLGQRIAIERERRNLLENAEARLEQLQSEVLYARDGVSEDGAPFEWVNPSSPMEAYPLGWRVQREGVIYRSLTRSNNYTPHATSEHWEIVKDEESE